MTFRKKKKQRWLLRAADWTAFPAALPVQTTQQDFVQTTPLRYIWYCFYWLLFPMSDFNMTRHLGHVWTVLKRNMLCLASARFTPSRQKTKGLLQRMFVFLRPLSVAKNKKKAKGKKTKQVSVWGKRASSLWLSHPPRPVLYMTYMKPLWLKSSSRFTCKWI